MTQSDSIDEGVCGHETADGTPCQHPASEGDSCWIDAHGGSTSVGRDFAITEADHDDILEAARTGLSKAGCARAAGVRKQNLQRYLESDENAEFRDAFMRARGVGEQRLVTEPLYEPVDTGEPAQVQGPQQQMNGQHARFLLSTSFGYTKTEKHELENTGDDPLAEVTIDFDDVDT